MTRWLPRPYPRVLLAGLVLSSALAAQHSKIVVGLPDPAITRALLVWREREVDGFARRLLEVAARETLLELEFKKLQGAAVESLLAHEIDVICPISIHEANLERMAFTMPIFIAEGAVFVRSGAAPPRTVDELRTRRVSVAEAGISHRYCLENEIPVSVGPSLIQALRSLTGGQSDCVLTTLAAGRVDIEGYGLSGLDDHPFKDAHMRQAFGLAVRLGEEPLVAKLNLGLARARDSGEWDELYQHWVAPYQPSPRPPSNLPTVIAAVIGAAVLSLIGVLVLRARLARRTRALAESEQRYRAVAESLPALIYEYFVGHDGRRERRLEPSNLAQWTRLFPELDPGTDHRALLGAMHPDDCERYEAANAEARARQGRFDLEYRLRDADGRYHWLHSTETPIRCKGGTLWQSFLLDTTSLHEAKDERHRLELQVLEAQRFEGLGRIAGGIAHDFNNLLMDVQGNLELALEAGDARRRSTHLSEALRGARLAAERTQHLLAGAGETPLQQEQADLVALARESAALAASAGEVTLRFEANERSPKVYGDVALLRQLVANLIANAADSVREQGQGSVVVRVGTLVLDEFGARDFLSEIEPGTYAMLEVEDDGVGMDEATRRRIFDPYFTTKEAGRGLGLAVVLHTVRRHGGALSVRSTSGTGAAFRVLLPLSEGREPTRELVPVRRNSGRILVVDDDERVLSVTCALIANRGWTVEQASRAEDALHKARAGAPDVVLLDLTMPGMNGLELMGRLRAEHPDLPVVLMSGYSERETVRGEIAADGFLRKPFTGAQLIEVLRRARARGPAEKP